MGQSTLFDLLAVPDFNVGDRVTLISPIRTQVGRIVSIGERWTDVSWDDGEVSSFLTRNLSKHVSR